LTAVSTIDVRIERRGSWVFSSTIELVPGKISISQLHVIFKGLTHRALLRRQADEGPSSL
jgi:hypothetical protein